LEELDGNWPDAEQRWREFAELRPAVWWGSTRIALALSQQGRMDEAKTLLIAAMERFPDDTGVFIEYARLAELHRDWTEAAARWATMAERFPRSWEGLAGQARALREQGQVDEAQALLVQTVARFPAATSPLHDLARLHEVVRNWPAAEQCWRDYVALDPSPWWCHVGLATALVEQGRHVDAQAALIGQLERMPDEPAVFIAHARLADRMGDWEEAERRWSNVAARFPHIWDGFGGQVRSLRHQRRLEEARDVLVEVFDRFAGLDGLLRENAELAEALGDWSAAEAAWRALIANDQRFWWFYAHLMRSECKQGRVEDAFTTFAEATGRFPRSLDILIDFARTLTDDGYIKQARGIVADALTGAFDPSAQELVHLAWAAIRCEDLECADDIVHRLRVKPVSDPRLAESVGHLESTLKIRSAELAQVTLNELDEGRETTAPDDWYAGDGDPSGDSRIWSTTAVVAASGESVHHVYEPTPVPPANEEPADEWPASETHANELAPPKESSWLRRAAGLFGGRSRK
jgi:tetratricopeptide (TPR) repeat protein